MAQNQRQTRACRSKEIETAFHDNYPVVQYAYVHFLSEHIADCSREFGGDLQQMLILSVIGQVFITNFMRAGGEDVPRSHHRHQRVLAWPMSAGFPEKR